MTVLEISPTSTGWSDAIAEHLALGEHAYVRFEVPTVTPAEMAEEMGLSRPAIMRWIKEGKIATTRYGNRHRIAVSEVERFRAWYIHDSAAVMAQDF